MLICLNDLYFGEVATDDAVAPLIKNALTLRSLIGDTGNHHGLSNAEVEAAIAELAYEDSRTKVLDLLKVTFIQQVPLASYLRDFTSLLCCDELVNRQERTNARPNHDFRRNVGAYFLRSSYTAICLAPKGSIQANARYEDSLALKKSVSGGCPRGKQREHQMHGKTKCAHRRPAGTFPAFFVILQSESVC
jgi:hypothetical protein